MPSRRVRSGTSEAVASPEASNSSLTVPIHIPKKFPPTFRPDGEDSDDEGFTPVTRRKKYSEGKSPSKSPITPISSKGHVLHNPKSVDISPHDIYGGRSKKPRSKSEDLTKKPRSQSEDLTKKNRKSKVTSKTSSSEKPKNRSRSSSWWRNESVEPTPIRADLPANARFVLASTRDLLPGGPGGPQPSSGSSTPQRTHPRSTTDVPNSTPPSAKSFVLIPREGLAEKIISTSRDEDDRVAVKIGNITTIPGQGGWLETCCVDLFCRAYGLDGKARENHHNLYEEALAKSQCSRRAFLEVMYGHSYNDKLARLRAQVPNYPAKARAVNKKMKAEREALLERLAVEMNIVDKPKQLNPTAPVFVPTSQAAQDSNKQSES